MNYKVEGAIRRNRKYFIIFGILWVLLAIIVIPLITYSMHVARISGKMDLTVFIETVSSSVSNPLQTFVKTFSEGAGEQYVSNLIKGTIFYAIVFFIGFAKSAPKHQYSDVEHGSSDWSKKGEQYKILNKNKGIILAENNYLPVDKQGNVNVLVVGRIRCG
ncbi:MAG: hypothetical protein HUJ68_09555 [Clostridia bacterium]|nr:hypothetical protein [Clostridia bacterium]